MFNCFVTLLNFTTLIKDTQSNLNSCFSPPWTHMGSLFFFLVKGEDIPSTKSYVNCLLLMNPRGGNRLYNSFEKYSDLFNKTIVCC